jgi:uncharacterized protein YjcR
MAARGRPSRLADAEFALRVATLFVEGMEHKAMAEQLECNPDTITDWVRDPRVLIHVKRLSNERTATVTRQIDAELLSRITDPQQIKKMDVDLLLKVRKELVGRGGEAPDANEGDMESGIWTLFDENPELAEAFQKVMKANE